MSEMGSIYGTTNVDGSNTLVIDFSQVQINGNLNVTNITSNNDASFNNVDIVGDVDIGGLLYSPGHSASAYYLDNNGRIKMHTRDLFLSAPWLYLGIYIDESTALHWDYPHDSAQGYSKIIMSAKQISASTSSSPWSDDRIKHFEKDIVDSLITIRKLKPMKYTKTFKIYPDNYNGPIDEEGQLEAGFIAQEVLKIPDLSYCVTDEYINDDGKVEIPYTLRYNDLFVYNIAATKELDTIVNDLSNNLSISNNKIFNLEAENAILKNSLNILLSEAGKPTI